MEARGFSLPTVMGLYEFVLSTFYREEKLKLESERNFWNPIFNSAMETMDCHEKEKGVTKYFSKNDLLIDHPGTENDVQYVMAWAGMDA